MVMLKKYGDDTALENQLLRNIVVISLPYRDGIPRCCEASDLVTLYKHTKKDSHHPEMEKAVQFHLKVFIEYARLFRPVYISKWLHLLSIEKKSKN